MKLLGDVPLGQKTTRRLYRDEARMRRALERNIRHELVWFTSLLTRQDLLDLYMETKPLEEDVAKVGKLLQLEQGAEAVAETKQSNLDRVDGEEQWVEKK